MLPVLPLEVGLGPRDPGLQASCRVPPAHKITGPMVVGGHGADARVDLPCEGTLQTQARLRVPPAEEVVRQEWLLRHELQERPPRVCDSHEARMALRHHGLVLQAQHEPPEAPCGGPVNTQVQRTEELVEGVEPQAAQAQPHVALAAPYCTLLALAHLHELGLGVQRVIGIAVEQQCPLVAGGVAAAESPSKRVGILPECLEVQLVNQRRLIEGEHDPAGVLAPSVRAQKPASTKQTQRCRLRQHRTIRSLLLIQRAVHDCTVVRGAVIL
mmetsp:Transcript_40285/g.125336  ORF Transcript_40285/g.125336 Transcript_40285/m.125336 type:complete len:270 (-) Transcript_40285:528-1337(-)